ncbi:MFS transporter [Actinosynnema sp. ALI-1.44]|uniref:peptide MFS transporter n=1 Tax=Actinosynnema sp. ALI-1.44 TaxID=1933779 RepID=UPI00097C4775|nr:oligopeptide:H+ symporter [Actinosynnema sp. ALI-1.44]ONI77894.1 MFS transporter [Actinosynnema sp. ALI-1.44]
MTGDAPAANRVTMWRMPAWYRALFSADLFERFGFYGLQAVLVLYVSAPTARGGLGLAPADAASVFGAWIALMFVLSLPGGWVGDRVLGQRPAMLTGCTLSVAGFLLLTVPAGWAAVIGLIALALGGGLFKPNHQALVNVMFGDEHGREAGISLMYVATQFSALLAPLAAGYLGERVSWSLAFAVCALALLLTGATVAVAASRFHGVGAHAARPLTTVEARRARRRVAVVLAVLAGTSAVLGVAGALGPRTAIVAAGLLSVLAPVVAYLALRRHPELGTADRRRLGAFLAVLLGATLFWMIIAHSASLLTLFARDHLRREVFGFSVPASWLQAAIPLFILMLAPLIAGALPRIGGRHGVPVKFAIGLILVGAGFLVMALAARLAADGDRVSPVWLLVVYLSGAVGEVVIAAVSIAATATVLPRRFIGHMLGMYWLFAALGGGLGSGMVQLVRVLPEAVYYLALGVVTTLVGTAFAVGRRRLATALSGTGAPKQGSTTSAVSS